MPFKSILKKLVDKTPGATGAIFLDRDGEAVADFSKSPDLDLLAVGAHKGIILNLAKDAFANASNGENGVKRIGISTDAARIAISPLKEDYYLVLILEKTGPFGRAFFESKKAIKDIEIEMG